MLTDKTIHNVTVHNVTLNHVPKCIYLTSDHWQRGNNLYTIKKHTAKNKLKYI